MISCETNGPRPNTEIYLALNLVKSGELTLTEVLTEHYAHLIDNPQFWWAFLAMKDELPPLVDVWEIMDDHKPQSVATNKELMLELCSYDGASCLALENDHPLLSDEQIVKAVLESRPCLLINIIPLEGEQLYPHLFGEAFARLPLWFEPARDCILFEQELSTDSFANKDFTLGWVKGGGGRRDEMPEALLEDEEIGEALFFAKKPQGELENTIPVSRVANKAYMTKAIENYPPALGFVAPNLKGDFDLAVSALATDEGAAVFFAESVDDFFPDGVNNDQFWFSIAGMVREKLMGHDLFVKLVLGSICFSDKKPSNFATLDQGEATSFEFKKRIAEYAGVATGKELGKLRRARKTLEIGGARFGFPKF